MLPKKKLSTTDKAALIAKTQADAQMMAGYVAETQPPSQNKNAPVWKQRAGALSCAIFEFPGTNRTTGQAFTTYSVLLQRSFRRQDGTWENTTSLRRDDCPKAILLLQKAYEALALSGETEEAEQ